MRHVYVKRATSMINDFSNDSLAMFEFYRLFITISYKNTQKIVVFNCDRPGNKARAKEKKRTKYHHFIFHAISQKPFCSATPFSPGPAKHTL